MVRQLLIQIATPYSIGTGFYLPAYDIIITNEHVVRDNQRVVIDGQHFDKQMADVVLLDEVYDIALVQAPTAHSMLDISMALSEGQVGDQVEALGHALGHQEGYAIGTITTMERSDNGVSYYKHTASLAPGNSGGPLIDRQGRILGVNTFLVSDQEGIGYTLPTAILLDVLDAYNDHGRQRLIKCGSCLQFNASEDINRGCLHCGATIQPIHQIIAYEALGIHQQVEDMLTQLGYHPELSRRGPYNWEVEQGSALIHITYHERTGMINGDAHLCQLPSEGVLAIYEYLLRANYDLEGLSFTIRDNEVILSLLIFDQYLNKLTALRLFKHLFEMADYYDDVLVDDYGCEWLDN